jgi:putative iron-dependent peroxidase
LLEELADRDPPSVTAAIESQAAPSSPAEPRHDGSLNIGSLKGISQHE